MKAILLDEAKKWLEENCENQYTRMAVLGIMQSMPTVDYQETPNEPLTLEQLREIKKPTPAWIVPLGEKGWDAQWSLRHIGPLVYFRVDSRKKKAKSYLLYDDRYGTDWLAYPYPLPHIDREAWTAEWRELHGDNMVGVNDAGEDMYKHYHYCVCKSCGKGSAVKTNFCPHCRKAMTDDAWAELERRLTK